MIKKETDIHLLLANQSHLGTKSCNFQMERYVYKRRNDGVYIINLKDTWEKLQMAARVIVAIENAQDIIVQSMRPFGQRDILKFSHHIGAKVLSGRHTPGTFTNQIQKRFEEPRLLIVTDPRTDHQPIKETTYVNIPVIAFCDTDSPLTNVDIAIPGNTKTKHSIGALYYVLAKMVMRMRANYPGHASSSAWQNWEASIFHSGLSLSQNPDNANRQENTNVKTETSMHTTNTISKSYQDNTTGLYGDFESKSEQVQSSLTSSNFQKVEKFGGGF
jgi:ribosomal protein uS2